MNSKMPMLEVELAPEECTDPSNCCPSGEEGRNFCIRCVGKIRGEEVLWWHGEDLRLGEVHDITSEGCYNLEAAGHR